MSFQFFYTPECGITQPSAVHKEDEVLLCLAGHSVLTVSGREWPLNAGDLACIPAGTEHQDVAAGSRVCGALMISPDSELRLDGFRVLRDLSSSFRDVFLMAQHAALGSAQEQAFAEALGTVLLHQLQCWDAVCEASQQPAPLDVRAAVRLIRNQIRERFQDPDFDLNAEIAATGYSASYFRRAFVAAVSRTPAEELRRMRLVYARAQLLSGSTASVEAIGLGAGFRDSFYFSRLFKQFSGYTPTEYRNRGAALTKLASG